MSFAGKIPQSRCCYSTPYDNFPSPPQNLLIFEVSGYNYRAIPEWFDETGQKMMNIQFSMDHLKLLYRWVFYKREDEICNSIFYLSTSDDIFPVIYELSSGNKMKVSRMARHNAYTSWKIHC